MVLKVLWTFSTRSKCTVNVWKVFSAPDKSQWQNAENEPASAYRPRVKSENCFASFSVVFSPALFCLSLARPEKRRKTTWLSPHPDRNRILSGSFS